MVVRLSGPLTVGACDLEYLKAGCDITAQTHLTGRLFYPADAQPGTHKLARWLPAPEYVQGYADFATAWTKTRAVALLRPLLHGLIRAFGSRPLLSVYENAPLAASQPRLPLFLFSHGLGGTRGAYSAACAELASAGFVVLAIEHADGTAAACRLAGARGWRFFSGWGSEAGRARQAQYRQDEVRTALALLQGMAEGVPPQSLGLGSGLSPSAFFAGRLDLGSIAIGGHSYGGATAVAAAAVDMRIRACVTLDPWWGALPPDSPALGSWRNRAPLLVLGSHAWNTPNKAGRLACGPERQARVLQGASSGGGGGAVLLVLANSSHDTSSDAVQLFAPRLRWLLNKLGRAPRLDGDAARLLTQRASLALLPSPRLAFWPWAEARTRAKCFELYGSQQAPELVGNHSVDMSVPRPVDATSERLAACLATPFTGDEKNMGEILDDHVRRAVSQAQANTQLRYAVEVQLEQEARDSDSESEQLPRQLTARCRRLSRRRRPSEERLLEAFLDGQARSAPLPSGGPPSPGTRSVLASMFSSLDDEADPNRLVVHAQPPETLETLTAAGTALMSVDMKRRGLRQ
ncbi:hypothetical protein WJX81_007277 [Elliptochloris bilobata]|uniref:1-alkyl-2-acetylglycerophosphocholine esterase n=1 Tax=Elliptochloris bilobata TaxID=381761 RepID=A0AAW1SCH5_9CHLO